MIAFKQLRNEGFDMHPFSDNNRKHRENIFFGWGATDEGTHCSDFYSSEIFFQETQKQTIFKH